MTLDKIEKFLSSRVGHSIDEIALFPLSSDTECYTFVSHKTKYFLKVLPIKKKVEICFENALLAHLNSDTYIAGKIPVVRETYYDNNYVYNIYDLIVATTLTHQNLHDKDLLKRIAKLHARLHDAAETAVINETRTRLDLFDFKFIKKFYEQSNINEHIYEFMSTSYTQLVSLKPLLPKRYIHEDLSFDNIFIKNNNPLFIDFGETHHGYRISDIAILIAELFIDEKKNINTLFIKRYLDSYNNFSQTPLNSAEMHVLPYAIIRRLLFMYFYYTNSPRLHHKKLALRYANKLANTWKQMNIFQQMYTDH